MKARNDLRFSFEIRFFKFLKNAITLEELIEELNTLEDLVRREEGSEDLEKGLCFRWFEGGTSINTIRNLEADLQYGNRNYKYTIENMVEAIELDTTNELQIYFA